VGLLTLAADAVAVVTFVLLHVVRRDVRPWADPVSQYGTGSPTIGYAVLTTSMAVAALAVLVGLESVLSPVPVGLVVSLGAFAVSRALIWRAPMDLPGAPPTSHGRQHLALAVVTFAAAVLMAQQLSRLLARTGSWPSTAALLHGLSVYLLVAALLTVGAGALGRGSGYRAFGLFERALYLGIFAWLGVVGWSLLTA